MTNLIKVAFIQHRCSADIDNNQQQLQTFIQEAAQQQAQLIVLPELHNTLYFCTKQQTMAFDYAESIPGPTTDWLIQLANQWQVTIVGSLFEKRASGVYHNTAVVANSNGELAGCFRKMHIPDDPGYNEKFYFTPGDANGFQPISVSIAGNSIKLGVLVCWDQWYPEAARLMALAGADLLLYPTAIGWDTNDSQDEQQRQLDAWQTIQRAHAVANHLPVIVTNRIGQEETNDFWGHGFICGPQGEWLCKAKQQTGVYLADIDLDRTEQLRRIWPFFRDRRIDAYHQLTNRTC